MRKDNVGKVTLWVQYSFGIIMWKFPAVQSKTEGMAASVRVFFEHPSYMVIQHNHNCQLCILCFIRKYTGDDYTF